MRVFGATTVRDADDEHLHLTASMRRMLSFIIAAGPLGVSADRALNELADGDGSAKAGSRLRMDVSRLRKRIGSDLLPSSSGQWRLTVDPSDVDYFALLASADKPLPKRPSELLALLSGEPFFDANPSPLVEEAVQRTLALRQSLLHRACDERPDLVDPQILLAARNWIERNPLNEDLITFVTQCHLMVGETTAARELLGRSLAAFTELLGETNPSFIETFETELGAIRPALSGLGEPEPIRHSFIDTQASTRLIGRAEEEAQIARWLESPDAPPLLLHGVSGAGKTTLLRSVANEANAQGQIIMAGSARAFETKPYVALAEALGEGFRNHIDQPSPPEQAASWSLAGSLIEAKKADVLLIVDDVQWLDSLSLELLAFLVRSDTPGLRVLLSGRATDSDDRWAQVRGDMLGANATEIVLGGLDIEGVEALVRDLRPEATLARHRRLAQQVIDLSNGLPGIACPLIREADEALLRITTSSQAQSLSWFVNNLSPRAKRIGRAAAILAQPVSYPSIAGLVETTDTELLNALAELADHGVLQSERTPGYFSFAHALIQDAFLLNENAEEVHNLHRRAAAVVDDIHRRASHQLSGMMPGEEATVARSLIASADAHYRAAALSEAVIGYQAADQLDAITMPTSPLIRWAGAADRLHLDGGAIRERAFDAAMREGSLELALDAACSGLPEAENTDGDQGRIRLLSEIDADLLEPASRFRHSATLARQLMLTGDAGAARPWIERALDFAETDLELDLATRTKWLVSFRSTSSMERRRSSDFFPQFAGETPDAILQLMAIDALASGEVAEAHSLTEVVGDRLETQLDPITYWLHNLFLSTLASAEGDHARAKKLSDTALRHGTTFGIREAATAWIAQHFVRTWMISGPEALLHDQGDAQNLQVEDSPLAQAAVALALFRAGLTEEAVAMATELATAALSQDSFASVAVLSICARILGPTSPLSEAIASFLTPLSGSLPVIGGGFACLGPIDLALAAVSLGDQRNQYFHNARSTVAKERLAGWNDATKREIGAIAETV